MDGKELRAAVKPGAEKRYAYFISKVAETEQVWCLRKDGWAMVEGRDGLRHLAVWPGKAFAEICASGEWAGYVAEEIDAHEFVEGWLPELKREGCGVAVFWERRCIADKDIDQVRRDMRAAKEKQRPMPAMEAIGK